MATNDYRNVLFDVFTNPLTHASFAIGETSDRTTVTLLTANDGKPQIKATSKVAAIRELSECLKRGYIRAGGSLYFDQVDGAFTSVHPDLSWGGKHWVLASNPPSLTRGIEEVLVSMRRMERKLITPSEVDAWAKRQASNIAYLVAFDDLPVWSLAIAETALQRGWPVRANPCMRGAPALLPSTNAPAWDEWLQQKFDVKLVREARRHLGFTFDDLLQHTGSTTAEVQDDSNLFL